MKIKNKKGEVIFTSTEETMKNSVVEAVNSGADLSGADLRSANLRSADLSGANLNGADLRSANLSDANLRSADLRSANLSGADLNGANLNGADLRSANLNGADLNGADLRRADLNGANLNGADLRSANLNGADLNGADLRRAYLSGANLNGADLRSANLSDANLRSANLNGANLSGAVNVPYVPLACPSDGVFVGWKKVNGLLIKLLIPDDARRSSATRNKCRCDKAKVIGITSIDGKHSYNKVTNCNYGLETVYELGKMVMPDSFDENRWNECSHGIHFFINKQDAINY